MLPSAFVSHGAPTLVIENPPARAFLAGLGQRLGAPSGIVVVSAHWESAAAHVLGAEAPATVHDFFGFPRELYGLRYAAPGAPALAARVRERLEAAAIPCVVDPARGLDHGAWIPLSLMYPAANVPVTELSVLPERSPEYHWRLGRALAALGTENVLVLGSGAITHNLHHFRLHKHGDAAPAPPAYASAFTEWMATTLAQGDLEAVFAYREHAPGAVRAHPTHEHLLPLFTALGAAGRGWRAERVHHSFTYGAIGMDCYLFHAGS